MISRGQLYANECLLHCEVSTPDPHLVQDPACVVVRGDGSHGAAETLHTETGVSAAGVRGAQAGQRPLLETSSHDGRRAIE